MVNGMNFSVFLFTNYYSKKKKCKNQVNPTDWNNVLSNAITVQNAETQSAIRTMIIAIKSKKGHQLERIGEITITKNHAKINWMGQSSSSEDEEDEDDDSDDNGSKGDDNDVPESFRRIVSKEKEKRTGCATTTKEIKLMHEDDDEEAARVLLTEMDDSEWWTMVREKNDNMYYSTL